VQLSLTFGHLTVVQPTNERTCRVEEEEVQGRGDICQDQGE